MWFSVVFVFIDNDTHHHSGQNVVDSRGAPHFDFSYNINVKEFFSQSELKKALCPTLTQAALSGLLSTTAN